MKITAAADGSALGNPGPAGWGWYVDSECWAAGGWPHGTNNMGELMAVLDLLQQTAHLDLELTVLCDSQYAINVITKWMAGWKRKSWKKSDGKPVQNVELVKALDRAMAGRDVTFEWVRGHAGHELNTHADRLAHAAATAYQQGKPVSTGPGFAAAEVDHPHAEVGQTEAEPDLFDAGLFASELAAEEDSRERVSYATPDDQELVIAAERDLLTDEVRNDPSRVAAYLHPEFREIGASGKQSNRTEILASLAPVHCTLDVVEVSRIDAETILLLWRATGDSGTSLRSSLWVRRGGHWVLRFQQGTPEQ